MSTNHVIIPDFTPQQIKRFWRHINIAGPSACWDWRTESQRPRYPHTRIMHIDYRVSRIVYKLHYGIDPGEKIVCHTCDRKLCCAPHHLFLGTNATNSADMVAKGRSTKGDKNPRRLYPERFCAGEAMPNAKLTEAVVRDLRARYDAGELAVRPAAREYGVSRTTMKAMLERRSWKHV